MRRCLRGPRRVGSDLRKCFLVVTVNTDDQQELAGRYKIASLPTVIAFRNGEPVSKFVGVKTAAGVQAFLKDVQA